MPFRCRLRRPDVIFTPTERKSKGLAHGGSCATLTLLTRRAPRKPEAQNVCSIILADMGVLDAWRIVPLPASGQIFNVSAFVLPGSMPVADDEQQIPMFPVVEGDPGRDLLFHIIEVQAEGIRMLAAVAAAQKEALGAQQSPRPTRPRAASNEKAARRHVPRNPDHRTWRGFVLSMQKLEKKARELELVTTKQAVCQLGSDAPKTVTRTMVLTYGLHPDNWPPSLWDPDQLPPAEANGQIF